MNWFTHYVIDDFYSPVWPNLAASAVCAVIAVKRIKAHIKKHRLWMNKHFQTLHLSNHNIRTQVAQLAREPNASHPTADASDSGSV